MPANTIQCGNCQNLMSVEDHHLGQQVRCPHCQQVVAVPGSAATLTGLPEIPASPTPGPTDFSSFPVDFPSAPLAGSPAHHEDDIFMAPAHVSDDLFGGVGQFPAVEMPPEIPGILPSEPSPTAQTSKVPQTPETGPVTEVMTTSPAFMNPAEATALAPPGNDWPATSSNAIGDLPMDISGNTPGESLGQVTRRIARRAKAESLFTTYLIIFLVPYAIFVTCIAAYFYWRMLDMQQRAPHPLEYLRDSGENPPAKRGSSSVFESISPDTTLPPRLQVALGQRLRIGDLEIVPLKVERRKLTICSENRQLRPQRTANDALVLSLRLRNVSDDVFFTPTDPVFDRQWKEEYGLSRPHTLLETDGKRFFGGPIQWRPRTNRGAFRADDPREYVKGQEDDNQVLKPGERRTSVLCTDPGNREILQAVQASKGPLVWRIHLRRGLVDLGDREVSATAVVGVVFDKKDILKASPSSKQ
jgi:hypothetical protein